MPFRSKRRLSFTYGTPVSDFKRFNRGSPAYMRTAAAAAGRGAMVRGALAMGSRAIPYVGAAYGAYKIGRGIYNYFKGKKRRYRTQGYLVGPFKKRTRKKSKTDVYEKKGFKNTTEVTGTVSDPDCVYIAHGTTVGQKVLTLFMQCALKKLFEISGKSIKAVTDMLEGYDYPNGTGWRICFRYYNEETGNYTYSNYDTVFDDSIYKICGDVANGVTPRFADFQNYMAIYATNAAGWTTRPDMIQLLARDQSVAEFYRVVAELDLKREVVHFKAVSSLRIQNRTLGADGNNQRDDVSNNPLVGKQYEFRRGAPEFDATNPNLETIFVGPRSSEFKLNNVNDRTGVLTETAANLNLNMPNAIFKEPLPYNCFVNLKKRGTCKLQPGNIKYDTLSYTFSATFQDFWYKLNWRPTSFTATGKNTSTAGKCTLFALEDVINVNSEQNISIAYECNRAEYMYLTTKRATAGVGMFSTVQQSS